MKSTTTLWGVFVTVFVLSTMAIPCKGSDSGACPKSPTTPSSEVRGPDYVGDGDQGTGHDKGTGHDDDHDGDYDDCGDNVHKDDDHDKGTGHDDDHDGDYDDCGDSE